MTARTTEQDRRRCHRHRYGWWPSFFVGAGCLVLSQHVVMTLIPTHQRGWVVHSFTTTTTNHCFSTRNNEILPSKEESPSLRWQRYPFSSTCFLSTQNDEHDDDRVKGDFSVTRHDESASSTSRTRTTETSRRSLLQQQAWLIASSATAPLLPHAASAADTKLEIGLLESRVKGNALNPPPYGMEGTDVFYPSWFTGSWNVHSTTTDIQAPCGVALFGGNTTYQSARTKELGTSLDYSCRFLGTSSSADDDCIADREYNIKSIAKVAMGETSIVDVSMATPNRFSCLIAPPKQQASSSNNLLQVDLIVLNRRQEKVSSTQFDCSEVVREIVAPAGATTTTPPSLLKEIETASLYTYDPKHDTVRCQQRSAAFLLPSNENPTAMRMWQMSGGRAIDVRYYDVLYTRRRS